MTNYQFAAPVDFYAPTPIHWHTLVLVNTLMILSIIAEWCERGNLQNAHSFSYSSRKDCNPIAVCLLMRCFTLVIESVIF